MATISEAWAIAVEHHRAGRRELAGEICRRILAVEPGHAGASALLRTIADSAEAITRRGIELAGQGKLDEAIAEFRRAVQIAPDYVSAHYNLACALKLQGNLDEAAACYRRTVQLDPGFFEAHHNLGNILREQGNLTEAAECYRRVVEIRPRDAAAHATLGNVRREQKRIAEAIACYRRAIELQPDAADVYNNLVLALKEQGKLDEALACCRRALELNPDAADAHNNLGNVLCQQGQPAEATRSYRRALELKPDFAAARNNLGNALKQQGKLDEALASYRRAMELKPDDAGAHSNLLLLLHYRDGVSLRQLAEAHAEFEQRHCAPLKKTWIDHANVRDPDRRLRVGFVSPDFGEHPVGFFLVRTLENLDRGQCAAVCYSDRLQTDALTARLKAAAGEWHDVFGLSHHELAERIRADRIDILFDLAGHTADNRLLAFARRPAPIQITWLGYVGTTGLGAVDYILADGREIPPAAEAHYVEKVLRMPDGYVCYAPPDDSPPVGPLPALAAGRVTFASLNNLAKITPQVIGVWAAILRRVGRSRLMLKCAGLEDDEVRGALLAQFAARGVEPERVELLGRSPHRELLDHYNRADVALDPFPYSGGLTTCEALWMGVPVITCPGETFASRHSLSHLSTAGLTETIAATLPEYIDLAAELANDLPRLAKLRSQLREQAAASPLCDGKRFADNLTRVLRDAWRGWCST